MKQTPEYIRTVYLILMLFNTLAASMIWGVNTIFLLQAGLTNTQAFAANAFFTAGQVLFEVPTGVVADTRGRRLSYLLGTMTLALSTLFYLYAWYIHAPFWIWAVSSIFLGLGFTFFSGATEAWLVDALKFTGFKGSLEDVFAKGQIVNGIAMLTGSVAGGIIAQTTSIAVPYILRTGILGLTFVIAYIYMIDLGFNPKKSSRAISEMKTIFVTSVSYGLKNPSLRWIMLAFPFSMGVSFYAFYAMQPFLLELYGDPHAYGIAGLAVAIVAGGQIIGGLTVKYVRYLFKRRTTFLLVNIIINTLFLVLIGVVTSFPLALFLLIIWGLNFSISVPIRQAYLNELIPSEQRATVLSFDSLVGSSGGVFIQPLLGRAADMWSYSTSYACAAIFQIIAAPFILLAKKQESKADKIN